MSGWRARRGGQPRRLVTRLIAGVPAAAGYPSAATPARRAATPAATSTRHNPGSSEAAT